MPVNVGKAKKVVAPQDPAASRTTEVERQLGYFDAAIALIDKGIFKIQNQDTGGLVSFVPKWDQRRLYKMIRASIAAGVPAFIIIPKARQIGFSTAIAILFLALALVRDTIDVLVAAHEDKSQRRIWKIYKTAWRNQPPEYGTIDDPQKDRNSVRFTAALLQCYIGMGVVMSGQRCTPATPGCALRSRT